jgi:hypothetical protein
MKDTQKRTKTVFLSILVMFLLWSCLLSPAPVLALAALPDIGIDYQTMKVNDVTKLTEAGMKNVRNGDTISMRLSPQEGKIIFKNLRTNEDLFYPPVKQKGKDR